MDETLRAPPAESGPVVREPHPRRGQAKETAQEDQTTAPPDNDAAADANGESAEVEQSWPMRVRLRRPVRNKDSEPVSVIEFREPTAEDIIACGPPVIPDYATGEIRIDGPRMSAMMSRLSKTPMPFLRKMHPIDWATCAAGLQRFFLPDLGRLTP